MGHFFSKNRIKRTANKSNFIITDISYSGYSPIRDFGFNVSQVRFDKTIKAMQKIQLNHPWKFLFNDMIVTFKKINN